MAASGPDFTFSRPYVSSPPFPRKSVVDTRNPLAQGMLKKLKPLSSKASRPGSTAFTCLHSSVQQLVLKKFSERLDSDTSRSQDTHSKGVLGTSGHLGERNSTERPRGIWTNRPCWIPPRPLVPYRWAYLSVNHISTQPAILHGA